MKLSFRKKRYNVSNVVWNCIDCGKPSTPRPIKHFTLPKERYRCKECYNKNRHVDKEIWNCVDCGMPSNPMYPSAFMQLKDQYRCYDCACTKRNKDPSYIEKTKLGKKRIFQDPKWQEANRKRWDDPLFRERNKLKNQELANDPIWKENHRKGQNKMKSDPDYQKMMTEKNQKLSNDPLWKEHIKMGAVKRSQNPQWILNNKLHIERITKDPLCRAALKRSLNTPEHHKKVSGENSHKWKGGITSLVVLIRGSVKMKDWKDAIFKRDGYKDYLSGCKGDIVAHHIHPFAKIIEQYKITTLEEALNCDALWDINNGITMLRSSHLAYHNMWGNDYE